MLVNEQCDFVKSYWFSFSLLASTRNPETSSLFYLNIKSTLLTIGVKCFNIQKLFRLSIMC